MIQDTFKGGIRKFLGAKLKIKCPVGFQIYELRCSCVLHVSSKWISILLRLMETVEYE